MAMLWLFIMALWTGLVLRLVGVRATLSERTFATHLVLGVLLGLIILPLSQKLLAPYGESGPWLTLLASAGRQAILVGAVAVSLFASRIYRAISVADVFLVGFAVGFGADMAGLVLAASAATQPVAQFSWFPPFQITTDRAVVAGFGYWTALLALTQAAVLRFGADREAPKPPGHFRRLLTIPTLVAAIVFLWVVCEQAALWRTDRWLGVLGAITLHGRLTAWLTLVILLGLSVLEAGWVGRALQLRSKVMAEWTQLIRALLRGRFREYGRLYADFGLHRQVELAQAESARAPADRSLAELRMELEAQLASQGSGEIAAPQGSPPATGTNMVTAASWAALIFLLLIVPRLPPAVGDTIWALPVWRAQVGGRPILALLLIGVLVWRFLVAAPQPGRMADPEEVAQFRGEAAILRIGMSLVLLSVFFGRMDELYASVVSLPASINNVSLLRLDQIQALTVLLILAVAATGITVRPAAAWRTTRIEERRAAVLRNVLALANGAFLVWFAIALYVPTLTRLHQRFGPALFDFFGEGGNLAGAVIMIIFTVLLTLVVAAVLRAITQRIESFFLGEPTFA